jgi:hypothetical protein
MANKNETRTSVRFCQCGVRLSISARGSGEWVEVFCPLCKESQGKVDCSGSDLIIYMRARSQSPCFDRKVKK